MKKILAVFVVCLPLFFVSSSFAAYTAAGADIITMGTGAATSTTNPSLTSQLSSNVRMDYSTTASSGLYYTIAAYHDKGSRTFSSTSNDSKIFYAITTGATVLTLPTSTASSAESTTWTTL